MSRSKALGNTWHGMGSHRHTRERARYRLWRLRLRAKMRRALVRAQRAAHKLGLDVRGVRLLPSEIINLDGPIRALHDDHKRTNYIWTNTGHDF